MKVVVGKVTDEHQKCRTKVLDVLFEYREGIPLIEMVAMLAHIAGQLGVTQKGYDEDTVCNVIAANATQGRREVTQALKPGGELNPKGARH